jgi:hypothetical protein
MMATVTKQLQFVENRIMKLTRKKLRGLIIEALTESGHDLSNAQKLKRLMQLEPDMTSRDQESFAQAVDLTGTLMDDDPEVLDMAKGVTSDYGKRFNPADLAEMKSILDEFKAIDDSPPPDIVVFHRDDIAYGTVTAGGYDLGDIDGAEVGLAEIIDGNVIQGYIQGSSADHPTFRGGYRDEDWFYFDRDRGLSLEEDVQNRLDAAREAANEMQDVEEETFFFLNDYFEAGDMYPGEIYRREEDVDELMDRYTALSRKMFGRFVN